MPLMGQTPVQNLPLLSVAPWLTQVSSRVLTSPCEWVTLWQPGVIFRCVVQWTKLLISFWLLLSRVRSLGTAPMVPSVLWRWLVHLTAQWQRTPCFVILMKHPAMLAALVGMKMLGTTLLLLQIIPLLGAACPSELVKRTSLVEKNLPPWQWP